MKKAVVFMLLIALVVTLFGCSSGVSKEDYDKALAEIDSLKKQLESNNIAPTTNADEQTEEKTPQTESEDITTQPATTGIEKGSFDAEEVISQLEVTTYSYSSRYYEYAFLEITNNSEFDLDVSAEVKFYDASGNLVGAKSGSQEAFQQGTSILMYFMPDESFATMDYELSASEEEWYDCVVADLSYESTPAKDKEIVSVTNNGTKAAEFVQAYILFFNGDKIVGFDWTYFTDDDSELKPGKTITEEMDCYESYDSYKIFFTGRR